MKFIIIFIIIYLILIINAPAFSKDHCDQADPKCYDMNMGGDFAITNQGSLEGKDQDVAEETPTINSHEATITQTPVQEIVFVPPTPQEQATTVVEVTTAFNGQDIVAKDPLCEEDEEMSAEKPAESTDYKLVAQLEDDSTNINVTAFSPRGSRIGSSNIFSSGRSLASLSSTKPNPSLDSQSNLQNNTSTSSSQSLANSQDNSSQKRTLLTLLLW